MPLDFCEGNKESANPHNTNGIDDEDNSYITIESMNLTCIETHIDELANSQADFTVFQEHSNSSNN